MAKGKKFKKQTWFQYIPISKIFSKELLRLKIRLHVMF